MKDIKELREALENYTNKDVSIRTEGSLRLSLNIHNMQCMITQKVVLMSNLESSENEEIEINVDDIIDIEINTEIVLEMNGNYNICISS